MAKRELDQRLLDLYDKGAKVYSYSKLSTISDCPYSAYISYIKKDRGIHNIYDVCGNKIHDTLEKIVNGEVTEAALNGALQEELDDMDMIGLDFPRSRDGGTAIRDKWIANMKCFCRDFVKPRGEYKTEQLLILKLSDNRYLQGYADLIRFFPDGSVQVLDWKTSSQFSTKDLLHYGRQLIAYSLALEQAGYEVRNPCWCMVKYCEVIYAGKLRANSKSDSLINKVCDRCKLAQTIGSAVKDKMQAAGYSDNEIMDVLVKFNETNDIKDLPDDISKQFKVRTYVREYPITKQLRWECINFINETADKFEAMEKSGDWPSMEINKSNEFKCMNLCSHRKVCPTLRDYLNQKECNRNPNDISDMF